MNISEKIKAMMICFLNHEDITSSWAISDINIAETNINFYVHGFNYTGKVAIEALDNGEYSVSTDNEVIFVSKLKDLLFKLDTFIEKSNDYDEQLKKWILEELTKYEIVRHNKDSKDPKV